MQNKISKEIELWLEKLGYSLNNSIYGKIQKMCHYKPNYNIMTDIILNSIEYSNPKISLNEAKNYTFKFIEEMKSNLIISNNYFQDVLNNGLFHYMNNTQDSKINLFDMEKYYNNDYEYLKDIWIGSDKYKRRFDFILTINELPLILIEILDDNSSSSFKKAFAQLQNDFDEFSRFFNFNKLIIFTDGYTYRIGTLYDFEEDYIVFYSKDKNFMEVDSYNIKVLEEILWNNNILKLLKLNKNSEYMYRFIENNMNKEDQKVKESLKTKELIENILIDDIEYRKSNINKEEISINKEESSVNKEESSVNKEESVELTEDLSGEDELEFLASFFNPDLEDVLESKDFKKKLKKTKEVPDFKENKLYIEDLQKNRNKKTLETFIKANEKLVLKEVNKFIKYQTTSMDLDDMYQLGAIGLLKAAEKFDLNMDNEFSTYATYWIRQSIIRGINNNSLLVRVPSYQWDFLIKLRKLEYRSEIKFNKIDYEWIRKRLDVSADKIDELIKIRNTFMNNISLDIPVGADGETSLGQLIVEDEYSLEDEILNMDLKNKIKETLHTLDDRSRDIIIKRFGLNYEKPMTLEEIGDLYNLTRERIRQIENESLKKLGNPFRSKYYKVYCEV